MNHAILENRKTGDKYIMVSEYQTVRNENTGMIEYKVNRYIEGTE